MKFSAYLTINIWFIFTKYCDPPLSLPQCSSSNLIFQTWYFKILVQINTAFGGRKAKFRFEFYQKTSTFNFSDPNLSAKQMAAEFFKIFAHKVCSVNVGCCFWRPESKIQIRLFTKKNICPSDLRDLASAILTVASKAQQCFRLCRFCKHFFCPLQLRLSCLTWKYVGSNQSWTYFLKMVYQIQQFCFL